MSSLVVQVVAPGSGGVRDYLDALRAGWARWGHPTHVIELSEAAAQVLPLAGQVLALQAESRQGGPQPGITTVLVHYSGYGYHKRGLCGWLVRELQGLKRSLGPRVKVVTMFHELAAFGPPWKSEFWLSGVQAAIAGRMARASDAVWTNSEHHARWLGQRVRPHTEIRVQPVFSTIGEPAGVPAFNARKRRVVIFGSAGTRSRAMQRLAAHPESLRRYAIEEAVEVGSGQAVDWAVPGLTHRRLGRLPEHGLSELMLDSAFALIDYPTIHLGKSTVFAAYAVHGCAVLNTCRPGPDADGLIEGRHYTVLAKTSEPALETLPAQGLALRAWYAGHALDQQVLAYARAFELPIQTRDRHA